LMAGGRRVASGEGKGKGSPSSASDRKRLLGEGGEGGGMGFEKELCSKRGRKKKGCYQKKGGLLLPGTGKRLFGTKKAARKKMEGANHGPPEEKGEAFLAEERGTFLRGGERESGGRCWGQKEKKAPEGERKKRYFSLEKNKRGCGRGKKKGCNRGTAKKRRGKKKGATLQRREKRVRGFISGGKGWM